MRFRTWGRPPADPEARAGGPPAFEGRPAISPASKPRRPRLTVFVFGRAKAGVLWADPAPPSGPRGGARALLEKRLRSGMSDAPRADLWRSTHRAGGGRATQESRKGTAAKFRGFEMEHASSHNSFNILFVVTFFASFATFLIHFG